MRKWLVVLAIAAMLPCAASGEIDLSTMSLDELIALREEITMAMWETEEWQEVRVPAGVYEVGVDIPAGHWTVTCAANRGFVRVDWGEYLDDTGEDIKLKGRNSTLNYINNPKHSTYCDGDPTQYSFEVEKGEYIIVYYGDVFFTPYAGKPALGFK